MFQCVVPKLTSKDFHNMHASKGGSLGGQKCIHPPKLGV
jgi:hypothetical protein